MNLAEALEWLRERQRIAAILGKDHDKLPWREFHTKNAEALAVVLAELERKDHGE